MLTAGRTLDLTAELAFLAWVLIGLALAAGFIVVGRRSEGWEKGLLSGSLLPLGVWYLAFGIAAGTPPIALLPQAIGGAIFAYLGWLGLRRSLFFAGLGWLIHGTWDFASPHFSDVSYMPSWTAPACLGFDILLGVYLLSRAQGHFLISKA